jgi:hypothetical protein
MAATLGLFIGNLAFLSKNETSVDKKTLGQEK